MTERIVVDVEWDAGAGAWIAAAPSIGLFAEAGTLETLKESVVAGTAGLLGGGVAGPVDVSILLSVTLDQRAGRAARSRRRPVEP